MKTEKLSDFIQSKVPSQVEFRIPFIKLDQTESLLNKLDTSKATGLDDLGPYFLKLSAEYIAPSITYLINLSILEGVFPSNLKIAKISPLFKVETNLCPEIIDQFLFYPTFQIYLKNMLPFISIFIFLNINYFMNPNLDSDVSIHATRLLQISLIGG